MKNNKVLILGSGIAGLASAARLASNGYEVTVLEQAETYGGKLGVLQLDEFRFDRGPSLFTMPALFEELFAACGERLSDYLSYTKLDEHCRYFFADGKTWISKADSNVPDSDPVAFLSGSSDSLQRYLKRSEQMFQLLEPVFLRNSLHRPKHLLNRKTLKALLQAPKLGLLSSFDSFNKSFFKDPNLRQFANRFATYNGSNPFTSPGTMAIIPHLEHGIGTFFPKGGMRSLSKAVYELALRKKVRFVFNCRVNRINTYQNRVLSAETETGIYQADKIISNIDMHRVYRLLLNDEKRKPKKLLSQELSSSALVYYWGISATFEELGLHNIVFSPDYSKEFNQIFSKSACPDEPTIYLNISSKHEAGDAPKGKENWFILVNAPADAGQDWKAAEEKTKQYLIAKLSRLLNKEIGPLIEQEKVWNPPGIMQDTGSYAGALYGNSSNNRFAAFLRHPNFSKKIKGLYFCGGSVHPGGGIPLCLYSAYITQRCISEDDRNR